MLKNNVSTVYPWVVISLCASLLFYKYILNVSPSIMSHELMYEFHINATHLGNLAAMFFYIYTIVQLFAGVLIDKFGVRFLVGLSVLVSALGAWLFAHTEMLSMALLARGMMGFGIAFATVTYLKMVAVWVKPQQAAFVGGLLATAVMLGAVFGQAPLAALLEHTNWRFVLEFCSILGCIIAGLFMLFIRDGVNINDRQGFSWSEVKKVFSHSQNWLLTLYSGLAFAPLSVLGGLWGPPFLQEAYHLSRTESAGSISLLFIGLGIGSPLFGLLSDHLRSRISVMKIGVALSLIAILFVIYFPTLPLWLLSCFLFLVGAGVGAFMLGFVVGTRINALPLAATVVALINTGDCIFESFTEPLLGKLLDLGWNGQMVHEASYFTIHNYHWAFIPLPLYFLAALILLFFIKEPR